MSRRYVLAVLAITVAVSLISYSCEDRSDPGEEIAKCKEASWYASYSKDPDEIDKAMDYFSKNCYWRTDGQPWSLNVVSTLPVTPASLAATWTAAPSPTLAIAPNPPWTPDPLPTWTPSPVSTPSPVPTPAPVPTPTPVPTPSPVPTPTPVPLTAGERQLAWWEWQCETHGVAAWGRMEHGEVRVQRSFSSRYLLDRYSDHPNTTVDVITIAGSRWVPSYQWGGVPLESDGAYSEGGTCLFINTRPPHMTWTVHRWIPDETTTIRLVPLDDDVDLTEEELTFTEGYHFLSKEEGYTGRFEVKMWWTGDPAVQPEDRAGQVILFNFWSAGPGRQEKVD